MFFFLPILCYSQSGDDPQEDLAKFDYKLHMNVIFLKHHSIFWLPTWTMYKKYGNVLKIDWILAIENLKMHMILTHFSLQMLCVYSLQKKVGLESCSTPHLHWRSKNLRLF
jgi:hypothetical protein